jgi:hypothetical protein
MSGETTGRFTWQEEPPAQGRTLGTRLMVDLVRAPAESQTCAGARFGHAGTKSIYFGRLALGFFGCCVCWAACRSPVFTTNAATCNCCSSSTRSGRFGTTTSTRFWIVNSTMWHKAKATAMACSFSVSMPSSAAATSKSHRLRSAGVACSERDEDRSADFAAFSLFAVEIWFRRYFLYILRRLGLLHGFDEPAILSCLMWVPRASGSRQAFVVCLDNVSPQSVQAGHR